MPEAVAPSNALVLAGAVARGAFEVGVLAVLTERAVPFRRVVGTSAGALNAAVVGAGLATGRAVHAAEVLEDLWLNHGAWTSFAHVSPAAWWHSQGLFDTSKVEELVRHGLELVVSPKAPVRDAGPPPADDLRVTLITTDLHGRPEVAADGTAYTVHERAEQFVASDFRDPARWSAIAKAAAASAAFPAMFAPPVVDGTARVDGGAVNNAPLSYAIDDPEVGRIFVVGTQPERPPPPPKDIGGMALVGHLADILIDERLTRDLIAARKTNVQLENVKRAMTGLSDAQRAAILEALGWRPIELVELGPATALEGTSFSGFFDAKLRRAYVDAGKAVARAVMKPA